MPADRRGLATNAGLASTTRTCPPTPTYGDGGRIPDGTVAHLCGAYRSATTRIDWQCDGILIVDNMLAATVVSRSTATQDRGRDGGGVRPRGLVFCARCFT
ncbi:hypothetical protein ABZ235_09280 [Streptomyces canus]|uniref:hypothetical protein n=1 Tax=Streptomyces canus TaxID=58343 RepID=UPI0033A938BB